MWSCVSLSLCSLQAPIGFTASAVPWCFCWICIFLPGSRPTVIKTLPSYLPKPLSSDDLSKHLVIQVPCHPFLLGLIQMTLAHREGCTVREETWNATPKSSHQLPASRLPPAFWLSDSGHHYCCLPVFLQSDLSMCYAEAEPSGS